MHAYIPSTPKKSQTLLCDDLHQASGDAMSTLATITANNHASLEFGDTIYSAERLAAAIADMQRDCRDAGIGASSVVVIRTGLSDRYVVALLALTMLNSCVIPAPPSVPPQLLTHIVESTGATAIVGDTDVVVPGTIGSPPTLLTVCGEDAAYVLFTSGSTGTPKGVVGSRHGLINRIRWAGGSFFSEDVHRCAIRTNPTFIDSLTEILGAYHSGRTMVVVPPDAQRDLGVLCDIIEARHVEQLTMTPSAAPILARVGRGKLTRVRRWILSGEELRLGWLNQLRRLSPAADIINSYGSTEVSGDVTHTVFAREDLPAIDVPIGQPAPGVQITIEPLTDLAATVAAVSTESGEFGELLVGGSQVAHGYLRTDDATDSNPFFGTTETRWFRTGDLVRRDGDILYYMGRRGPATKVRGRRVDLSGVADTLESLDGVAHAHAWVGHTRDGTATLQAAVTVDPGATLTAAALVAAMRDRVPTHLVPDRVQVLSEFPYTASGKVDRHRLESVDVNSRPPRSRFANGLQYVAACAITDAVSAPEIGPTTPLLDVGLDSLQAVRVADDLSRYLGCQLTAVDVLSARTVQEFAERIPSLQFAAGLRPARIVQDGDPARTLLLLHPAIGTCLSYFVLLQHLSYPGRIVFIEQDDTARATLSNEGIRPLAQYYAQQATGLLVDGRVDVAGYSFGALIAPTVAAELAVLGHQVSSVILIDPAHVAGTTGSHDWALRRVLTDGGYGDHLPEIELKLEAALHIIHRNEGPLQHAPDALVRHWAHCLTINTASVAGYRPPATTAPTLLLRATDTSGLIAADTADWITEQLATATVIELPGTHFEVLNGDSVGAAATAISDFLLDLDDHDH